MKSTTIRKIALSQLDLSPKNVRKASVTKAEDEALEASIAAHGLQQNLGVEHAEDGRFLVYAGGRRFNALCQLLIKGVIEADYKVPCTISESDQAIELSLVENVIRAGMHPADEFEAFNRLIEGGASVEDVADRFGTTVKHVTQRMKLARVAPEIVALYRDGEIRLEVIQAFAVSDSHDRQREILERVRSYFHWGDHAVHQIRQTLTETFVSASSRLGRFVGIEAYEAAGGIVTRDLFSNHDSVHLNDRDLVETLAIAKLEERAAELRKEWRWAEVMIDLPYDAASPYGRVYPEVVELESPELQQEWDEIEEKLKAYGELDELTAEDEQDIERLNARWEEIDAAFAPVEIYTDEVKAIAGCLVAIDHGGTIRIEAGLIRPEDMPAPQTEDEGDKAAAYVPDAEAKEPALRIMPPRAVASHVSADGKIDNPQTVALKDAGLTGALADDLRAIRHQITQAHLAGDFSVAFDLMLYSMCQGVFGSYLSRGKPIDVKLTPVMVTASRPHLEGTVAERMLETLKANLRLDWMNLPKPEDFAAMSALPSDDKQALFAFAASHGLTQQLSVDHRADPVFEAAGNRLGVDVAACWRPTAGNFFGRVTKDHMMTAARETVSEAWAEDHKSYKKGALADIMERAFSEDGQARAGLSQDKASRTARWLPDGMGFSAEIAEASEADPAEEPAVEVEALGDDQEAPVAGDDGDEDDTALPAFLTTDAA
ncbi:chromosome partitioning protein, ParB family [Fulvimarina manganoxydans]|uniref:Chromosome partitioning protein, ParB family n=1 Tax=Fulvimarina manganoxydans TaxID=937218 RepID=A0A1W2C1H6_9HYPH|nr:ParB/RepB/Spo0J family partition protein [Fulvimarina manganoxydans]MCK5934074.1 ParB/RepB/Spo0J family partition protein [Fulvimarina manganoxydans]SMC78931.1 chromosome partitioning protein, ParB family [Fulvimarina manganoxydans]